MLFLEDNGNSRLNRKHHHSTKNSSNSQLNSASNTNFSGDYGRSSDDYDNDSSSAKTSANNGGGGCGGSGGGGYEGGRNSAYPTDQLDKNGLQFNSFYCISLGDMTTNSNPNPNAKYISARPSFNSDPIRTGDDCDKVWIN